MLNTDQIINSFQPIGTQPSDLPIEVEPVEAQCIDLPIVVEPIEAHINEWYINYGNEVQGLIRNEREASPPFVSLEVGLMNTFAQNKYAIIILEGYMMALIHNVDSAFYLFDPHARNSNGVPCNNGTAVVMKCATLSELEHYLHLLSSELNTNCFEIVSVEFQLLSSSFKCSPKTNNDVNKQTRVKNNREYQKIKRLQESEDARQTRMENDRVYQKRKLTLEGECQKQTRLEKIRKYKKRKQADVNQPKHVSQHEYLKAFDILKHGCIHEQCWAKQNIAKFHKSNHYFLSQCTVCKEVWPLKSKPKSPTEYICLRCRRDKKSPQKFSFQNSMIPSPVPGELNDLTQIEEMLIARALPIMRVYIKPGGQQGYSGHCIQWRSQGGATAPPIAKRKLAEKA
jgi:hypothetical protein